MNKHEELQTSMQIVDYMNLKGAAVWLNEISGMPCKVSRFHPTGRRRLRGGKDSSDIIGTLPGGRAFFCETKKEALRKKVMAIWNHWQEYQMFPVDLYDINSKENQHIAGQCNFLMWQRKAGAFVMFAFSLDDIVNIEKEILK